MTDYMKLIKALRECKDHELCTDCKMLPNGILSDFCNIKEIAADALEAADKRIENLKKQLPKEGEWRGLIIDGQYWAITCSNCHQVGFNARTPYCPNCGAKMKGENDEQIH